MTRVESRLHWLGFGLVLLLTQVVYLRTMTVTTPFWDSGEFIATSYILGIPHPPGTPLYVLIGRLFSLLPLFPLVATRVNWLSALASSLTAAFTYLVAVELWLRLRAGRTGSGPAAGAGSGAGGWAGLGSAWTRHWPGVVAGLVAGFFTAFGRTFWDNAIEAEVYALSSLIMALSAWLILKWARWEGDRQGKNGLFALLYYLICLSMGIHLGTFLVLPGIMLFALLVDRTSFGESRWGAWLLAGVILLLHPGMLPTLGLGWGILVLGVTLLVLLSVLGLLPWRAAGLRGLLTWCLVVAVLALTTHFYLMIRARLNPAINEADPETWDALWKVLTRDQYKPANPFVERQAPWSVQLTKHFWDYAKDQYALGLRPAWVGWYLPYVVGLLGVWSQWVRDRKGLALVGVSWLIMSLGLVFYLNFKTEEVRPRDYFFVASFQFFAIWIGLGAAWLVSWMGRAVEPAEAGVAGAGASDPGASVSGSPGGSPGAPRWIPVAAGVLLCALPWLTVRQGWFEHDRTEFWVARDFAHNMLAPLKPNAILLTNGDNDTFPLWYLQTVEGVRRDVTVANLSLLNTDWYIRQLRDHEPKVDLGWTDAEVARLRPYLDSRTNRPMYLKDIAVQRIVEREYGRRPIYIATTVPDLMGYEDRVVMLGVVFELQDRVPGSRERIDAAATLHSTLDVFRYRALLRDDGTHDPSVFKDPSTRRLVQNYSAALIRAAEEISTDGDAEMAHRAIRRAVELTPWSRPIQYSAGVLLLRLGKFEEAEQLARDWLRQGWTDSRAWRILGRVHELRDNLAEAEAAYRRALAAEPDDFDTVRDVVSFYWQVADRPEAAADLLRDWNQRHPGDRRVTGALRELESMLGTTGGEP